MTNPLIDLETAHALVARGWAVVQTIARISQDKAGAYWFNALCREFDDPFAPVLLRPAPTPRQVQ